VQGPWGCRCRLSQQRKRLIRVFCHGLWFKRALFG